MDLPAVARFMERHSLMLTTAESCTAGLIAAHLADVPGAGALLDCAFVAYSCRAKEHCLAVRRETIERFNLTSEAVAVEMAYGALSHSVANVAIANTGVADDTDPQTPAGTQCFAWLFRRPAPAGGEEKIDVFSETRRFAGSRNAIREAAALFALQQIPRFFAASPEAAATEGRPR